MKTKYITTYDCKGNGLRFFKGDNTVLLRVGDTELDATPYLNMSTVPYTFTSLPKPFNQWSFNILLANVDVVLSKDTPLTL